MNGCQYLQPRFTLPASNNVDPIKWDMAFMTKKEVIHKWGVWVKKFYEDEEKQVEYTTHIERGATFRRINADEAII
jgi:hypothetical protein